MAPPARLQEDVFAYEAITTEIQRFIDSHPRGTQQKLAEACFPDMKPKDAASEFRHRLNEREGSRFSYEHLGRIAKVAGQLEGLSSAPFPWPLLSWQEAEALAGILAAIRGARS